MKKATPQKIIQRRQTLSGPVHRNNQVFFPSTVYQHKVPTTVVAIVPPRALPPPGLLLAPRIIPTPLAPPKSASTIVKQFCMAPSPPFSLSPSTIALRPTSPLLTMPNAEIDSTYIDIPKDELADKVMDAIKSRYSGRQSIKQTSVDAAKQSLDLLRQNIQPMFSSDVQRIIQKYIETYITPAMENIKDNLGDSALEGNYLQTIGHSLLENAKDLYEDKKFDQSQKILSSSLRNNANLDSIKLNSFGHKRKSCTTKSFTASNTSKFMKMDTAVASSIALNLPFITPIKKEIDEVAVFSKSPVSLNSTISREAPPSLNLSTSQEPSTSLKPKISIAYKTRPSKTSRTAKVLSTNKVGKTMKMFSIAPTYAMSHNSATYSKSTIVKPIASTTQTTNTISATSIIPTTSATMHITPAMHLALANAASFATTAIPSAIISSKAKSTIEPETTKVFWDIGSINSNTKFILDYKANEALGCCDRNNLLTNKHPELVRYLLDGQDIEWLYKNNIVVKLLRGYRPLILVLDEVQRLAASAKYRDRARLCDLDGFCVPEFMIKKIRAFFRDLDEANKLLLNEAALKIDGKLDMASASASFTNAINAITSLAAIKQIPRQQIATTTTLSSVISSMRSNSQPTTLLLVESSRIGTKTTAITLKTNETATPTAKSSLSSSHATLSALLKNTIIENS